ncbi:MAG: transcriptional regulator [Thermoproteota archaeon]
MGKRKKNELHQMLLKYGALDNELRLKAFLIVGKNPGISFNELARKLKVEKGLLAYHLGVLKSANLLSMNPQREGKKFSHYSMTEEGREFLEKVFPNTKY